MVSIVSYSAPRISKFLFRVLDTSSKQSLTKGVGTLMLMDNFANSYVDLGQPKEAERMRGKVLKVRKRTTRYISTQVRARRLSSFAPI